MSASDDDAGSVLATSNATPSDIWNVGLNVTTDAKIRVEYVHVRGSETSVMGRVSQVTYRTLRDEDHPMLIIAFEREVDGHTMFVRSDGEIHTSGSYHPRQGRVTDIAVSTETDVDVPDPVSNPVERVQLRAMNAYRENECVMDALRVSLDMLDAMDAPLAGYLAVARYLNTRLGDKTTMVDDFCELFESAAGKTR